MLIIIPVHLAVVVVLHIKTLNSLDCSELAKVRNRLICIVLLNHFLVILRVLDFDVLV